MKTFMWTGTNTIWGIQWHCVLALRPTFHLFSFNLWTSASLLSVSPPPPGRTWHQLSPTQARMYIDWSVMLWEAESCAPAALPSTVNVCWSLYAQDEALCVKMQVVGHMGSCMQRSWAACCSESEIMPPQWRLVECLSVLTSGVKSQMKLWQCWCLVWCNVLQNRF